MAASDQWSRFRRGASGGGSSSGCGGSGCLCPPGVAALARRWVGGPPAAPLPLCSCPDRVIGRARQRRCTGPRKGPSPLTLQVLSPWQRPRPWGRAGGGETARLSPPTVAWLRPGLGDSVPVAAEARVKGRGTREREGGRAPRFAVGRATHLPSHQPGRGTTGRASGERDHTISSPAAASSIFPGLEWTFWRMYLNE